MKPNFNPDSPAGRRVVRFLREREGQRFDYEEVTKGTGLPMSTTSSQLSDAVRYYLPSRGAGIYAYVGQGGRRDYAWMSSYPKDDPMLIDTFPPQGKRPRAKGGAKTAQPNELTLTVVATDPYLIASDGTSLFKVLPLEVA